jgi:hypothetical protein
MVDRAKEILHQLRALSNAQSYDKGMQLINHSEIRTISLELAWSGDLQSWNLSMMLLGASLEILYQNDETVAALELLEWSIDNAIAASSIPPKDIAINLCLFHMGLADYFNLRTADRGKAKAVSEGLLKLASVFDEDTLAAFRASKQSNLFQQIEVLE